jgi:D-arabinose 1-dehydrogenase-like Zn-dependent alcohol dehydrogenase
MRELMDLVQTGTVSPIPVRARPLGDAEAVLSELRDGKAVGRMVLTP